MNIHFDENPLKGGLGRSLNDATIAPTRWRTIILATLLVWLSGSLLLDVVIMPNLYAAGMMGDAGFAIAGYLIFSMFNRVELLSAALVLTGVLVLRSQGSSLPGSSVNRLTVSLALLLVAIPILYTYGLTPHMSGLGLTLNLFEASQATPAGMNQFHLIYWVLETLKVVAGSLLLRQCYQAHLASK